MNELALAVYQLTLREQYHPEPLSQTLSEDERAALQTVQPLIRQTSRSLARLLEEEGPLDVWLAPTLSATSQA